MAALMMVSNVVCCNSKVEELFLASQLRLNAERLIKKSQQVNCIIDLLVACI